MELSFQKHIKTKILSIQISFVSQSEIRVNAILFEIQGDDLQIDKVFENSELSNIFQDTPKNIAVYVNFDGKGIIHKIDESKVQDENVITSFLPYADEKDYEYQSLKINGSQTVFSIIKSKQLYDILNEIEKQGYFILKINFGPFILASLFTETNFRDESISTGQFSIASEKDSKLKLLISKDKREKIEFNNYSFSLELAVAYANIFTNLDGPETHFSGKDYCKSHGNEFQYKKRFTVGYQAFLAALFTVLLVNFILFTRLTEKNNSLSEQYQDNEVLINTLNLRKKELVLKQSFLDEIDNLKKTKFAYYSDRIGYLTKGKIQLNILEISPLLKKIAKEKKVEFIDSMINISGVSKNADQFNSFLSGIKDEFWVDRVNVLNYEKNADDGLFSIEIILTASE
ncbi:MAG: hypothetical protein K9H62_13975 [Bacteroidales bacterium]|nr:hypothetical protein [Bacteroidales bacterium]